MQIKTGTGKMGQVKRRANHCLAVKKYTIMFRKSPSPLYFCWVGRGSYSTNCLSILEIINRLIINATAASSDKVSLIEKMSLLQVYDSLSNARSFFAVSFSVCKAHCCKLARLLIPLFLSQKSQLIFKSVFSDSASLIIFYFTDWFTIEIIRARICSVVRSSTILLFPELHDCIDGLLLGKK